MAMCERLCTLSLGPIEETSDITPAEIGERLAAEHSLRAVSSTV